MFYAISYDIRDDRRRLRVAKVLKDFGSRVQLSVFEAHLENRDLERLRRRLGKHLDLEADSVRFYPLCAACCPGILVLGQGVVTQDPEVIII
jgi:CRISPR-associated protein Cas2